MYSIVVMDFPVDGVYELLFQISHCSHTYFFLAFSLVITFFKNFEIKRYTDRFFREIFQ